MNLISYLLLFSAVILIVYLVYQVIKNRKIVEGLISLGGISIALATAFYSIYASNQSIKSAEGLSLIQNKPYVIIEGMRFFVDKETPSRDANEDVCRYQILLRNSGALPATNASMKISLSFKNLGGSTVVLSNDPKDKDAIIFTSTTNRFVVGTGAVNRVQTGTLYINKEDSMPLVNGERNLAIIIKIDYSTADYDKKWFYKLEGIWNGKSLDIYNETIS